MHAIPADPSRSLLGHLRVGSGPRPVVVLHEWLADHRNYAAMTGWLDGGRFTWILADLRGYGLSRDLPGDFTAAEASADVLRLMDGLGHRRFDLVGHSMSGMIAQRVALDAPERVGRLVLISPVPPSGFRADAATLDRMAALIHDDVAAREAIAARTGHRYGAVWLDRKLALLRSSARPEAMRGYLRMFTGTDFAAQAAGLPLPILALLGEHDIEPYREPRIRAALEPLYPALAVRVCREAGHYMMLEAPVFTASSIDAALDAAGPPEGDTP
ncbi:alpha/beta fold hydrolase [Azospirillum thermophilum]|nr:alpha/beta hydrolase [Azospirillum thermophilum]